METEEIFNPKPETELEPAPTDTGKQKKEKEKKVKKELSPEQKAAKGKKIFTAVTFLIALACLLAGLFAPLGPGEKITDKMLFTQIPAAVNLLLFPFVKKSLIPLPEGGIFYTLPTDEASVAYFSEFNATAFASNLALTLYALLAVIGLFMLIPILAGKARTGVKCAYVIEALSLLSLGVLLVLQLTAYSGSWKAYHLLVAFGGTLLVAFIQSIGNKGGLGVSKVVLFIISALTAFFVFDVAAIIPALSSPLGSLSNLLKSGETANFAGGLVGEQFGFGFFNFYEVLKHKELFELSAYGMTALIVVSLTVYMVLINLGVEAVALTTGSKFKKNGVYNKNSGSSAFAIIRYVVTLLLAAASVLLLAIKKEYTAGIYLYIILALTLISLLYVIFRAVILSVKHKKSCVAKENAVPAAEDFNFVPETDGEDIVLDGEPEQQEVIEETTIIRQPVFEQYYQPAEQFNNAPVEQPQEAYEQPQVEPVEEEPEEQLTIPGTPEPVQPAEQEHTIVYNYRAVYNGPTDEFMDTLSDEEKIEFVQVFIEKKKGKVSGVPDYTIGQDNSDFFPAVFVHINRARNVASSNLLEKIYRKIGS